MSHCRKILDAVKKGKNYKLSWQEVLKIMLLKILKKTKYSSTLITIADLINILAKERKN